MELLIDAELKMFKGIKTPVIFLQNVITDLLLGLQMTDVLKAFHDYIVKKYDAEPGFITMNMPKLLEVLEKAGIEKIRLYVLQLIRRGSECREEKELYEKTLHTKKARIVAMQVFAGGAISQKRLLNMLRLPNIQSILFGASSQGNIQETVSLIRQYDLAFKEKIA
jgi:hypothetical protein